LDKDSHQVEGNAIDKLQGGMGKESNWAGGGGDNGQVSQKAQGQEFSEGISMIGKEMELSQGEAMSSAKLRKALEEIGEEEEVSKEDGRGAMGVEQLATIPEASSELSSVRRSKRRAGEADKLVGLTAERRKSVRNEGTSFDSNQALIVPDSDIISNLHSIGVSLGQDSTSVNLFVSNFKSVALGKGFDHVLEDMKVQVLEKEEQEEQDRLEEEELDNIFLKNICSEIMKEVMDMGSDVDVILPKGPRNIRKRRRGKKVKKGKRL
jgi:hypothetical protein